MEDVEENSALTFPSAAAVAATAVLRTAMAAEAAAETAADAAAKAAAEAAAAATESAEPVAAAASEVAVAAIAMAAVARAAAALARDTVGKLAFAPVASVVIAGGSGPRRCRGGAATAPDRATWFSSFSTGVATPLGLGRPLSSRGATTPPDAGQFDRGVRMRGKGISDGG